MKADREKIKNLFWHIGGNRDQVIRGQWSTKRKIHHNSINILVTLRYNDKRWTTVGIILHQSMS